MQEILEKGMNRAGTVFDFNYREQNFTSMDKGVYIGMTAVWQRVVICWQNYREWIVGDLKKESNIF